MIATNPAPFALFQKLFLDLSYNSCFNDWTDFHSCTWRFQRIFGEMLVLCANLFWFSFSDASVFTKKGKERIGKIYKKAVYREYTDKTFSTQKPHPEHLGIIGPVLRGEDGDTIVIYFKVRCDVFTTKGPTKCNKVMLLLFLPQLKGDRELEQTNMLKMVDKTLCNFYVVFTMKSAETKD